MQEQFQAYRAEWRVEREIERVVSGSEPLVVGPWLSEVGYEVLYWVPFVRWVKAAFRIDPSRMIVMSRGGAGSWYADITPNYVDVFDELEPAEFSTRNIERSEGERIGSAGAPACSIRRSCTCCSSNSGPDIARSGISTATRVMFVLRRRDSICPPCRCRPSTSR